MSSCVEHRITIWSSAMLMSSCVEHRIALWSSAMIMSSFPHFHGWLVWRFSSLLHGGIFSCLIRAINKVGSSSSSCGSRSCLCSLKGKQYIPLLAEVIFTGITQLSAATACSWRMRVSWEQRAQLQRPLYWRNCTRGSRNWNVKRQQAVWYH